MLTVPEFPNRLSLPYVCVIPNSLVYELILENVDKVDDFIKFWIDILFMI
jgi:hypothetical protein